MIAGKELASSLQYVFYIIFRPFKGFWELKKSNRGNYTSATILLGALVLVFIFRRQATGFLFNFNDLNNINIVFEVSSIVFPFLLWCIANWSITTLVEGEGSLKDIYIATAYALSPLILLNAPLIMLSHIIINSEAEFYYLIHTISIIWSGFLILIGIMTIHQFSLKKTIATILVAIVSMIVIFFLIVLFFSVISQLINFLLLIYRELSLR